MNARQNVTTVTVTTVTHVRCCRTGENESSANMQITAFANSNFASTFRHVLKLATDLVPGAYPKQANESNDK